MESEEKYLKPNVMVIGGTGVGKTALVNHVFGFELGAGGQSGAGTPVTKGCVRFEQGSIPVVVFDTEGYELRPGGKIDATGFEKHVIPEIQRRSALELPEQFHLFWYCISATGHRVTPYDIQNLRLLESLELPVAIVFTQCDAEAVAEDGRGEATSSYRSVLTAQGFKYPFFETSTRGPDFDIDHLLQWSSQALKDERLKDALAAAQRRSLPLKRARALKCVAGFAIGSASVGGLNPLPASDAALIAPQQVFMATQVSRIYGFPAFGIGVTSVLKGQILSSIGKSLASSLTKFVPGAGQAINAVVAGSLTGMMGYLLVEVHHRAYVELMKTGREPDWQLLLSQIDLEQIAEAAKTWLDSVLPAGERVVAEVIR